ncbi:APH(3') family aminoglycoside O-phosphotransferase [Planomonospora sp. ID82291]|uniref:APH(3') family aminoglycoside O-phosphotransferase n=1 Tax=Planomonospora sp. ID82291 TaxID=2738136 RepID=UPI0018C4474F|nr:APH(3') family aminoglycoside O-phosphotransferase [Planomonospora sp. ID82291]MBG0814648.1 aminoglycoside 3'-phosphotransferase [Planomonospora sp. ID82291]
MEGIPGLLRRRYHRHEWNPVQEGMSGAAVWRLDGRPAYFAKIASQPEHPDSGFCLSAEAERLIWLRDRGIPAPEVVEHGTRDGVMWLVTTVVPGRSAAAPWPQGQRDAVVDALADLARTLHALPIDDCPFDRGLAVTLAHARQAATAGLVDLDDLDDERRGWDAEQLLTALEASVPAVEDRVVCHGDLCLPNVLLDPETLEVTGVIDAGRLGVADRYADLALATRSLAEEDLNPQYGPAYAKRFLARYGITPDPGRIAFYRLLDEFF